MTGIRLASLLFFRMFRDGHFTLLLTALILSTAVMTTAFQFNRRAEQSMSESAALLMGGDLVVSSHQPMDRSWQLKAEALQLQHAEVAEFPSMLLEHDALLLVSVRAIPGNYPLRGFIERRDPSGQVLSSGPGGPRPGEVWAEPEVLRALDVALGGTLTVGDKTLRLSHLLTEDPTRRGTLESLSPRILIHADDIAETHVIGPGSHLAYQAVFAGPRAAIRAMQQWLRPRLAQGQTLSDLEDSPPDLGRSLKLMRQFIALTAALMSLLAAIAIGLSARSHALRCRDLVALLRCHGLSQRKIYCLFLVHGLLLAFPSGLIGLGLALLFVQGLNALFWGSALLPYPEALSWSTLGLALFLGPVLLVGFAFSHIHQAAKTPPTQVLHRSGPNAWRLSAKPLVAAIIVLVTLQALASGDLFLSLKLSALGGVGLLIMALSGRGLLAVSQRLLIRFPVMLRIGLARLVQQPSETLTQLIGFSVPLACLTLVASLESDLMHDIKAEFPTEAPTHFVLNLFDSDLDSFGVTTRSLGIVTEPLYPVVRGRLIAINQTPALERSKGDMRASGAINRDLALTFSEQLPSDNQVIEGQFNPSASRHEVSMEQDLAERLGVRVGDHLQFDIQGDALTVEVSSLRRVHWRRMTPNFYFIFSKGILEGFPRTWMTSLRIPKEAPETARALAAGFPASSLIDLSRALAQVQTLAEKITRVARPILWLSLVSTGLVLVSTAESTAPERRRDARLLRLLGVGRARLAAIGWVEFAGLGLLSGLGGIALAESVRFWLYRQILDLPFDFSHSRWLLVPPAFAFCIALIGQLTVQRLRPEGPDH